MGTRADFYVGRGAQAEWLGSIAWDGYPDGIAPRGEEMERLTPFSPPSHKNVEWPEGQSLFDSTTEAEFRERLTRFFRYRDDVTLPADGWPWPWETSHTTDYAYAFDDGSVWTSCFGRPWVDARLPESSDDNDDDDNEPEGERPIFPDMTDRQNVTFGKRSGVMIF